MTARHDDARLVRASRGGLAALSATFVALASHLAAGGEMPGLLGVVVPLALSLPVCVAWAGRRLSLLGMSGSVVASQFFFHLLFVLGTPSSTPLLSQSPTHAHGAHTSAVVETTTHAGHAGHGAAHTDATMWLWHAVAAAVTVIVLYRGELMLLRLRNLAVRTAAWLIHGGDVVNQVVTFVAPARSGVPAQTFRPLHPGPQLTPLRRRGPPAPHAV